MMDDAGEMTDAELRVLVAEGDMSQGWVAAQDKAVNFAELAMKLRENEAVGAGEGRSTQWLGRPRRTVMRAGVAVATVVATGLAVMVTVNRASSPGAFDVVNTASPETNRTYATHAAQVAHVTLPDGSTAVLGPNSTVRVIAGASETRVTVDGEALFDVTHRKNAAFSVRAGAASVRVLGTRFSVRRYQTDATTKIVVVDGRVAVHGEQRATGTRHTILGARTLGVVDDSGVVRVVPNVATDEYLAWTTGTLVFRETLVADIAAELSRAYGAPIKIRDSTMRQSKLTFTVPVTKRSLDDVLTALALMLNAKVTHDDSTMTLIPGAVRDPGVAPRLSPLPEKLYGR
jgi:ferric-dicitrate binding protein FerR (iron transport regulator)